MEELVVPPALRQLPLFELPYPALAFFSRLACGRRFALMRMHGTFLSTSSLTCIGGTPLAPATGDQLRSSLSWKWAVFMVKVVRMPACGCQQRHAPAAAKVLHCAMRLPAHVW